LTVLIVSTDSAKIGDATVSLIVPESCVLFITTKARPFQTLRV